VFKRLFAWLNKCEICGTPYCHDRTCDELKLDLRAW